MISEYHDYFFGLYQWYWGGRDRVFGGSLISNRLYYFCPNQRHKGNLVWWLCIFFLFSCLMLKNNLNPVSVWCSCYLHKWDPSSGFCALLSCFPCDVIRQPPVWLWAALSWFHLSYYINKQFQFECIWNWIDKDSFSDIIIYSCKKVSLNLHCGHKI